ncbi:MAG: anti-sigma factor family protein [Pyrinomonadaceae bacterium]
MLCKDFEEHLTDYIDSTLEPEVLHQFAEHSQRCPICHDLLNEVRNSLRACHTIALQTPVPSANLEAQILLNTMPETHMACEEFEQYLTDYLDGFLVAPLFHRWERHALICGNCTNLPGQVVRAIGACYSYKQLEIPVSHNLHERILCATIGTTDAKLMRAPLGVRMIEGFRGLLDSLLDPIVTPRLATVATMFLLGVIIGTSTISDDGSLTGMYRVSLRLAERTYMQSTQGLATIVGASR